MQLCPSNSSLIASWTGLVSWPPYPFSSSLSALPGFTPCPLWMRVCSRVQSTCATWSIPVAACWPHHCESIQFSFHCVWEWFLQITDLTWGVRLQAQTSVWFSRTEPRPAFPSRPPSLHRTWVLHSGFLKATVKAPEDSGALPMAVHVHLIVQRLHSEALTSPLSLPAAQAMTYLQWGSPPPALPVVWPYWCYLGRTWSRGAKYPCRPLGCTDTEGNKGQLPLSVWLALLTLGHLAAWHRQFASWLTWLRLPGGWNETPLCCLWGLHGISPTLVLFSFSALPLLRFCALQSELVSFWICCACCTSGTPV